MKIWIWEYLGKVSDSYHCDGGLVVIANDEEERDNLILAHGDIVVDCEADIIANIECGTAKVITFPNAGCC